MLVSGSGLGHGPRPSSSGWLNETCSHVGRPSRSLVFGCGAGPPCAPARGEHPRMPAAGREKGQQSGPRCRARSPGEAGSAATTRRAPGTSESVDRK